MKAGRIRHWAYRTVCIILAGMGPVDGTAQPPASGNPEANRPTGAFAGTTLASAPAASETPANDSPIPFETLLQDYTVESRQPEMFVLRSEADERRFLQRHPPQALLAQIDPSGQVAADPFDEVDYDRQIVVGVLAGLRPNISYAVSIEAITTTDSAIVVHATEEGSSAGGQAITYPAHVVVLDRRDVAGREIRFAPLEQVCARSPCVWERH